ncbi:hypothetical protein EYF80_061043 [Liparis tanakae]|uniref:Uncharacterized protein n=1 Tax=Liparis tanakae TaxID=230148 RepID=A0A4Z2EJ67_9TELE|nr:hypothetical protein EYF80_061043 [Liparis tanakae]
MNDKQDRPGGSPQDTGCTQHISPYTTLGAMITGLTDTTPRHVSGDALGGLLRRPGPQGGVGDRGLRAAGAERKPVGGRLAARVPELLVDPRVLSHVGGRGGVEDQAHEKEDEGQQPSEYERVTGVRPSLDLLSPHEGFLAWKRKRPQKKPYRSAVSRERLTEVALVLLITIGMKLYRPNMKALKATYRKPADSQRRGGR